MTWKNIRLIPSFLLAAVLLTSCATPATRSELTPTFSGRASSQIAIGVVDSRSYVLSGEKEPWFEGIVRGGFGIPHTFNRPNRPPDETFADRIAEMLRRTFADHGSQVTVVKLSPGLPRSVAIDELRPRTKDVALLVRIHESNFDAGGFTFAYVYQFELDVLDQERNMLGHASVQGRDAHSPSTIYNIWDMYSVVYKSKFQKLLAKPEIQLAITSPSGTVSAKEHTASVDYSEQGTAKKPTGRVGQAAAITGAALSQSEQQTQGQRKITENGADEKTSVVAGDSSANTIAQIPTTSRTILKTVVVDARAAGKFGAVAMRVDEGSQELVAAHVFSGPGQVTLTANGKIDLHPELSSRRNIGPSGKSFQRGTSGCYLPLEENFVKARGYEALGVILEKGGALFGAFVPASIVNTPGFRPFNDEFYPGGISSDRLFLIGKGRKYSATEPGTLYLGINDCLPANNSGAYSVAISGMEFQQEKTGTASGVVAAATMQEQTKSIPSSVAIFPFGTAMPTWANSSTTETSVVDTVTAYLQKNEHLSVGYSYYGSQSQPIVDAQTTWQGSAVQKQPSIPDVVSLGRKLGVDIVLMVWYWPASNHIGTWHDSKIDLYVIDVHNQKIYSQHGAAGDALPLLSAGFSSLKAARTGREVLSDQYSVENLASVSTIRSNEVSSAATELSVAVFPFMRRPSMAVTNDADLVLIEYAYQYISQNGQLRLLEVSSEDNTLKKIGSTTDYWSITSQPLTGKIYSDGARIDADVVLMYSYSAVYTLEDRFDVTAHLFDVKYRLHYQSSGDQTTYKTVTEDLFKQLIAHRKDRREKTSGLQP